MLNFEVIWWFSVNLNKLKIKFQFSKSLKSSFYLFKLNKIPCIYNHLTLFHTWVHSLHSLIPQFKCFQQISCLGCILMLGIQIISCFFHLKKNNFRRTKTHLCLLDKKNPSQQLNVVPSKINTSLKEKLRLLTSKKEKVAEESNARGETIIQIF